MSSNLVPNSQFSFKYDCQLYAFHADNSAVRTDGGFSYDADPLKVEENLHRRGPGKHPEFVQHRAPEVPVLWGMETAPSIFEVLIWIDIRNVCKEKGKKQVVFLPPLRC